MNIRQTFGESKRQTTAEEVFHRLKDDILSLRLVPGAKLSEVEVAKQFDVSRQPVREAFMRLGGLKLLQIRPQKATRVSKISLQHLTNTRFIRAAVEVEVVRVACQVADKKSLEPTRVCLEKQKSAVEAGDAVLLHELDYEFHRLICNAANCTPAFDIISEFKAHTDRVCLLELSDATRRDEVLEDHSDIVAAIAEHDEAKAIDRTRHHLAHLDATLKKAHENHPDFFEA